MKKVFLLIASLFAISVFCACDTEKNSSGSESAQSEISSPIISSEETEKTLYYEAELTFYVTPIGLGENDSDSQYGVYGMYGNHVMDNMVKLLDADSFAARLLTEFDGAPAMEDESYSVWIAKIQNAVNYFYEPEFTEDGVALAKSFIYVNISVSDKIGEEFANNLYTAVVEMTPAYVEENMAVPSGYTGTECSVTRTSDLTEVWK